MQLSSASYGLALVYVSHRLLAAEARLQCQAILCGIFGGKRGAGTGLTPSTSAFLSHHNSTDGSYLLINPLNG